MKIEVEWASFLKDTYKSNSPPTALNNWIAYEETKASCLIVSYIFARRMFLLEQFENVLLCFEINSDSCVFNFNIYFVLVEAQVDSHSTFKSIFYGIADQVDADLLQTSLVTQNVFG